MGLDTSHDCWHGSYSSFTRWRHAVARAAGYWVLPVKYENGMWMDCIMLDWGHLPKGHLLGEWEEDPEDPLLVLLTHSDCEGVIKAKHCAALATKLQSLLPELDDTKSAWKSDAELTRIFIAGLRKAAKRNQNVNFH